jgi:hypothetical protein
MKTILENKPLEQLRELQAKLRYSVIFGCKATGYSLMVADADEQAAKEILEVAA